jgi:DNA-binding response OmpR family regulator
LDSIRIAVVNHEPGFLVLMHEFLSGEGYEPMCWQADEDRFTDLKGAQPALAILDVVPHQRDAASALLERIHNEPTTAHIPVIICTADVPYVREKAPQLLEYGYAVVEKPFNLEDLLATMRHLLESQDA